MEDPSQIREQIALRYIKTRSSLDFIKPSKTHFVKVLIKLLPIAFTFRKDRREWVKREGRNIDEKKYRKHAQKALKAFIQLGPSYIKLGQWLSTRADILPHPYLEVFEKLQDDVPPAPFHEVKPIIENEIGKIESTFETFNIEALSGASLGQVYLATYRGKEVILKVGRPKIEEFVEYDIYILQKILPLATRFIDPNLRFSAEAMLSQFIETIHEEMDYRLEAHNLTTIKNNLAKDRLVIIPELMPELTSRHVITMEYIPGIKITDIKALDAIAIDREKLVGVVHRVFFKMLLRDTIFHADPHPGNISVSNDGAIILYDFGMVGRLDNEIRVKLIRLYLSLIEKDPARAVNALMELGTLEPTVNRYLVNRAIEMSIQSLHGKEIDKLEVKALTELANKTMSRFPFRLPKNLALYMRMTSILEGIHNTHQVRLEFIKVLRNLLEEEGLLTEAYIEEAKNSIRQFVKNIEASLSVAPLLISYLESQSYYGKPRRHYSLLAGAVFASALFVGSSMILPYNSFVAYSGLVLSAVTIAVSLKRNL